jgi:hypothetical protein
MIRIVERAQDKHSIADDRYRGRTEPQTKNYIFTGDGDGSVEKVWKGKYIGDVVEKMNNDLGAIPDNEYRVIE